MLRRGYEAVATVLKRRGWREVWETFVPPIDLRAATDDPVEAVYRAEGRRCIVGVDLDRCRAFNVTALICTRGAGNPFVDTLVSYGAGNCRSFADSPLRRFYESWQPASLAEAIGVRTDEASAPLTAPPSALPALPWAKAATGVERGRRLALKQFREAQRRAGVEGEVIDGIIFYGPVTPAFGAVTFERLKAIYDSIRLHGYQPEKYRASHLAAQLLVRDGDYRVLIRGGKHRIAALAALGHHRVTVQLCGRYHPAGIYREDARSWPNVRSGLYTHDQALDVFDRMFEGRQPPGCTYPGTTLAGTATQE